MDQIIKVLIIEDDDFVSEELQIDLQENGYIITSIATSLQAAIASFYLDPPDIAIIDIFLNGKPEGIDFAKHLASKKEDKTPFVFLTGNKEKAIFEEAKLTAPYSFLLKPYNKLELFYAIELAVESANQKKYLTVTTASSEESTTPSNSPALDFLFVKKNNIYHKLAIGDITYIEVEGRYSKITTLDKPFLVQFSLVEMEKLLPSNEFIRIHRNYIIQKNKIVEIHQQDNLIVLSGKHTVNIGRTYKDDLFDKISTLR